MTSASLWHRIPPWGKAAGVAGIVVVLGALASSSLSIRRYLGQAFGPDGETMPWASEHLGFSSATIRQDGCMLAALAMASNVLLGTDWDPSDANDIIKAGNGFSGANLILPEAASDLGLFAPDDERIHARKGSVSEMATLIDATLSQKGVALVNVDKTFTGTGEHFVLVYKKDKIGYAGADPATAQDTYLDPDTLSGVAIWGTTPHIYDAVGVAPIFRA